MQGLHFGILGPLEVQANGVLVPLGGKKQRAVLAALVLHRREFVARETLVDYVWGDAPPATAATALQVYVSQLRRVLEEACDGGASLILTRPGGYLMAVETSQLDLDGFEQLVQKGRRALREGDADTAALKLRAALAMWRGPPLADLADLPVSQAASGHLAELRLTALEDRLEADLALGRHADVVGELTGLVGEHPFRERFHAQRMLALYRSGRQAEALAAFQEARAALVENLGLEPSQDLRDLETAILRQDPDLRGPAAAVPAPSPAAKETAPDKEQAAVPLAVRKTVTVLSAHLSSRAETGESLDPEIQQTASVPALQAIVGVLEKHGATVERLPGDRTLGIFGVPLLHDDDASRAVHAAAELSREIAGSPDSPPGRSGGFAVQVGVATGEVLVGEGAVHGNAVTLAVDLSEAAAPGAILMSDATYQLVRHGVLAERQAPVGSDEASAAWSLRAVDRGPVAAPSLEVSPLVGRDDELRQLRQAFDWVQRERATYLFTVLGAPGVGKSRLVSDFTRSLDDARVLVGPCLSYGEGITYWPLAEMVGELAGADPRDELAAILEDERDGERILARVLAAIGFAEATFTIPEEAFWAFRKLFETLARERPLVLVFEDIHWAETSLLDLIDHVATWSRAVPILLVCVARPDLLDQRPGWGGGRPNATARLVEPLAQDDAAGLVQKLLGDTDPDVAERVAAVGEGNPLFVEQLLAMLIDDEVLTRGERGWVTDAKLTELAFPPQAQALADARLDRLPPSQSRAITCASVIGEVFDLENLMPLAEMNAHEVETCLSDLVRKELVRPDPSDRGTDAFRFRHALIRDAAYRRLPKQARAALHERFADGVAGRTSPASGENDEIIGHHLEQAYRYRSELGSPREHLILARRAAHRLADAGRRAWQRSDASATASLLERAMSVLPDEDPGCLELAPDLAEALLEQGEFGRAAQILDEAIELGQAANLDRVALHAEVIRLGLHVHVPPEQGLLEVQERVNYLMPRIEELADDRLLAKARRIQVTLYFTDCQGAKAEQEATAALSCARRAADRQEEAQIRWWLVATLTWGPAPVPDAFTQIETILVESAAQPAVQANCLENLSLLHAMQDRFDESRQRLAEARSIYLDFGLRVLMAFSTIARGKLHLLHDDPTSAERELRAGYEALDRMGERSILSGVAMVLAEALYRQERLDEAEEWTRVTEAAAAPDDVLAQIVWRGVRAKALARRGVADDAETLARQGCVLAARTDWLTTHADALVDEATVLHLLGREREAASGLQRAVALYERKGDVVSAARTRAVLEEIR